MSLDLGITIKSRANYLTWEQWIVDGGTEPRDEQLMEPGEQVRYMAHLVGGMVKVNRNGQHLVIHPACTVELS